MALQANIPLHGGISHNNGYVRVTNARLCRKDNEDDWFLMVDVSVYKDKSERNKENPQIIPCSEMDRFKYSFNIGDETKTTGGLIELAYTKLKTESVFKDADDA